MQSDFLPNFIFPIQLDNNGYQLIRYEPIKKVIVPLHKNIYGFIENIIIKEKSIFYSVYTIDFQEDKENKVFERYKTTLYCLNLTNKQHKKLLETPYKVCSMSLWNNQIVYVRDGKIPQIVLYDIKNAKRKVLYHSKNNPPSIAIRSGCVIDDNYFFVSDHTRDVSIDSYQCLQQINCINLKTNKYNKVEKNIDEYVEKLFNNNNSLDFLSFLPESRQCSKLYRYKHGTSHYQHIPYKGQIHSVITYKENIYFTATYRKYFRSYSTALFIYKSSKNELKLLFPFNDFVSSFDIIDNMSQ